MFVQVEAFLKDAIENGKFDVAKFLELVAAALKAIFGFVAKEEGIEE